MKWPKSLVPKTVGKVDSVKNLEKTDTREKKSSFSNCWQSRGTHNDSIQNVEKQTLDSCY